MHLPGSDEVLRVAYVGNGPNKTYFFRLILGEKFKEKIFPGVWFFLLEKIARKERCHLLIYEAMRERQFLFHFQDKYKLPVWIRMEIDLVKDKERLLKKNKVKEAQKTIQKHDLTYETSRRPEDLEFFFHKMYEPYVRPRFGDSMIRRSYEDMLRSFKEHGEEVLFMLKNGERIAGQVVRLEPNSLHVMAIGILDGSAELQKLGLTPAMDLFSFQRAEELKLPIYNLGHCRPFLSDGVLNYKNFIGAKLTSSHLAEGGFFYLDILNDSPSLEKFFVNNPFIVINNNGQCEAILLTKGEKIPTSLDQWQSLAEPFNLRVCAYESKLKL